MVWMSSILWDMLRNFSWFAGVAGVIWVAEIFWPAGPNPALKERLHNFLIFAFTAFFLALFHQLSPSLPNLLSTQGLLGLVFGGWKPKTIFEFTLSAIVFALIFDFFQYWQHRAMHAVPTLWDRAHALHHEAERMHASVTLRATFWGEILGFLIALIPTWMICGTSLLTVYSSTILFATWGFFNHANIRLRLGPLTKVVSGPQLHRIHHGKSADHHDKNFAALFPIWDVVFGTYRAPSPEDVPETGLIDRPQGEPGLVQAACDAFGVSRARG